MSSVPGTIRRLDPVVVNRIAAGEVIQRPSSALKELIENSLDAKSTWISVTVKGGGLKLLQIQDNGCGIKKDDMGIVCERFTTSKLQKFEDLSSIQTYGFRGEALASISHVAHLSITTRTHDSKCAYKAFYCDGKLAPLKPGASVEPKPCAGNQGTQITVEDVFYNMPTRRKALKNPSEEYTRIFEVVSRYAVHNAGVGFTLKKQGESMADVRTTSSSSQLDVIRSIYGAPVARELLEVSCEEKTLGMKFRGLVSNANYSSRKLTFLLFINHRLVDSTALRRLLESLYSAYLPKGSHPFIYVSLEISPANVDVNVHPTKHEVHFLHEDAILERIKSVIEDRLLGANTSRTMFAQTVLPGSTLSLEKSDSSKSASNATHACAQRMVRTDAREQTLDTFLVTRTTEADCSKQAGMSELSDAGTCLPSSSVSSGTDGDDVTAEEMQSLASSCLPHKDIHSRDNDVLSVRSTETSSHKRDHQQDGNGERLASGGSGPKRPRSSAPPPHRRVIHLTSVANMQRALQDGQHTGLRDIIKNHKFVGCATPSHVLFQHQTKLYVANVFELSQELFYQIFVFDFGNFGSLRFQEGLQLRELALLALQSPESGWTPEDGERESLAKHVEEFLVSKADMLEDYFAMKIDKNGQLQTLPLLLEKFIPNMDQLPMLILRLATEVEWSSEQQCFETFGRELSCFYAYRPSLLPSQAAHTASEESCQSEMCFWNKRTYKWIVEHVLLPTMRSRLLPPTTLGKSNNILQLADLPELYKVFERC